MFRRRREKKTDYVQRMGLLKSGLPRLVVRRSLSMISTQVVEYNPTGDKTVEEVTSKDLKKYGWKHHTGNIPAGYLSGLLIGLLAQKKGIKRAVLDIGMQRSVKGSSIYATAKGVIDSGLEIYVGEEIFPDEARIKGKFIADYAKLLKEKDKKKYDKQFSSCIKEGGIPENIEKDFEETKSSIIKKAGVAKINA